MLNDQSSDFYIANIIFKAIIIYMVSLPSSSVLDEVGL